MLNQSDINWLEEVISDAGSFLRTEEEFEMFERIMDFLRNFPIDHKWED